MPFTAADAKRHKEGLTGEQESAWAKIANAVLKRCQGQGNSADFCEGKAVRVANAKAVQASESVERFIQDVLSEQQDLPMNKMEWTEVFERGEILREASVDKGTNRLSNVILLGKVSANNRTYSDRAMNDAVRLYEGAGFYIDHPTKSELRDRQGVRSVYDLAGRISNPRRVGESVRGDIELLDRHKMLIFALAEQMPSMVGCSHRAEGTLRQDNGTQVVESLDKVFGVELVTDPATVNGLFESIQHDEDDMKTVTLEQLKKERPDLVKAVLAEAEDHDKAEALAEENKKLKKELDEAKTKDKERERDTLVRTKLEEAKLPKRLITDVFKEQLKAAEDEKAMDALINERKEIAKGYKDTGPRSTERDHDQQLEEGDKKEIDESKIEDYGQRLGVLVS